MQEQEQYHIWWIIFCWRPYPGAGGLYSSFVISFATISACFNTVPVAGICIGNAGVGTRNRQITIKDNHAKLFESLFYFSTEAKGTPLVTKHYIVNLGTWQGLGAAGEKQETPQKAFFTKRL